MQGAIEIGVNEAMNMELFVRSNETWS